jgi:hypothetical protein
MHDGPAKQIRVRPSGLSRSSEDIPPERFVRRHGATRRVVESVRPVPLQHLIAIVCRPTDSGSVVNRADRSVLSQVNGAAIHGNGHIGDIRTFERPLIVTDLSALTLMGKTYAAHDAVAAQTRAAQEARIVSEKPSFHRAAFRGTETPGAGLGYGGRHVAKPSDGEGTMVPQLPKRCRVFGASRPSDRSRQDVQHVSLP